MKSPKIIIFLTVLFDLIGFGIVIPLISIYGRHFGATPSDLALLGSAYSVMQFIFAPMWGALSDKIGRRPVLLVSLLGSTGAYILFGLAESFNMILISRALAGLFAANISTAQAYMSDISTADKRASAMGMIGAAFGLGFLLGPPLGGISAHYLGLGAPGLLAGTICGANFLFACIALPESLSAESRRAAQRRSRSPLKALFSPALAANRRLLGLVLVFFGATFAFAHFEQCFSLLLQTRFFPATQDASLQSGILLGWSGILGVIIQGGLMRRIEKKVSLWKVLYMGLCLAVGAYVLLPYLPTFYSYFAVIALLAVGGALANPALSALISKEASGSEQGKTMGISQAFGSLARALAPSSAQFAFGRHYSLPFLMAGAICAGLIILVSSVRPRGSV